MFSQATKTLPVVLQRRVDGQLASISQKEGNGRFFLPPLGLRIFFLPIQEKDRVKIY